MARVNPLMLLFGVALAAGCPAPPEGGGEGAPQPPANQQAASPASPAAQGAEGGGPPPVAQGDAPAPAAEVLPPDQLKFSRFIQADTPTVKIDVDIEGVDDGQIDFQTFDKDGDRWTVRLVHTDRFKNGHYEVEAPAHFDQPIYVSAFKEPPGKEGQGVAEVSGALPEPIELNGEDVHITVKMGQKADWTSRAAPSPDAALPNPPGGEGGQAGAPAGPPPEGAAPPPEGAAPPPEGAAGPPPEGAAR